ncbi:hypothetical protein [Natrinema salsiterrestre]|uniref:Uncharacterized protein n=1 Tax=Natrinema salsiterrestre TaxID=2950540 RepID=A0A9Q4Q0R0_9EURY|nr:hypothetical protein [Natrinema salsiterrestre]MDF9746294.1 hypothetical protein [Natrinema salsiterrestre]
METGNNSSDEFELRETDIGTEELIFPDGSTEWAETIQVGKCTVAATTGENVVAVFVDGELSFTIDEYVQVLSPLNRSIEVSETGYIAYHTGEHQEKIFNLVTWEGETVLQRVVEVARRPSFTPNGNYVAFWRLSDKTIYCYDVEDAMDAGRFQTTDIRDHSEVGRAVNIGVEGVTYQGDPAFKVTDTYGGDDELLGYISPTGDLLETTL